MLITLWRFGITTCTHLSAPPLHLEADRETGPPAGHAPHDPGERAGRLATLDGLRACVSAGFWSMERPHRHCPTRRPTDLQVPDD